MIRRIKIQGYKSLQNVELSLQPLTVVFGPNAAGKSNLFDALGLLSRLTTSKTLRDAFDPKVHRGVPLEAFNYGAAGLEGLLAAPEARFTIEADIELSDAAVNAAQTRVRQMREGLPDDRGGNGKRSPQVVIQRLLRYRVTIELVPTTGVLRVADEYLTALNPDGTETQRRQPFIEKVGNRLRLRMEKQAHPTENEVGLDYTLVSSQLYPPHYPHITAFREEVSRWHFYYLEPDRMRADAPIQEISILDRTGEDLAAFYHTLRLQAPKRFDSLQRALRLLLPNVDSLDVRPTSSGLLELDIQMGNAPYSSRLVSEGTLRILGLLAITRPLVPVSVIGYEEPENGVHPRRLQLIADLLVNASRDTGVQFLINTHSPLLPDYLKLKATLVACTQADTGTHFELVGPLFAEDIVQRILQGDFGG